MGKRYFTPKLFTFLRDLEANNDREWFKANQDRYIEDVREPAQEFINDFAAPLAKISPYFVADSRTVGGSLFRIQRDTRFSKDKTPYKTNTGVQFRHQRAKDAHAPGFYLNLQPGECYMGVGVWRPESRVAYAIRGHIDDNQTAWKRAVRAKTFSAALELTGDSLVRPPRGFADDHPLIDDLKRKDFIASTRLKQTTVMSDTFLEDYAATCRAARPFVRFLCDAIDIEF